MTKVTSNKPTKTSPLGGAALGALGNIDKQTTAINQALLTMMPASSVESTKAGNAPAIPAAEQAASTKAIKNIITELKEIQGMTALASFIAITLEADQPKDTKLVEDIAQIAQDVTKLLADPKMGAAKATLATNLDAKVGQNIVSLAKDNLDTDEQNAVDAAIPGGVFSNDGTIDISAILILMITLNAKLRKTEQDSSIATAKAQSKELKKAADKMIKAATEAFTSALAGGLISIAGAAGSLGMNIRAGSNSASNLNKVQEEIGLEPAGIPESKPTALTFKNDPLSLSTTDADMNTTALAGSKFTANKKAVSDSLQEMDGGDGSKTYVNENGTLTSDGLAAYEKGNTDFTKFAAAKGIDPKTLFDKNGKLTDVGQKQLAEYRTQSVQRGEEGDVVFDFDAVDSTAGKSSADILQYIPDELNQAMVQPKKAANYVKYVKGIESETDSTRLAQLTKERDAIKQTSADYENTKDRLLKEINTKRQSQAGLASNIESIARSSDQATQAGLQIRSKSTEADAQKDQADAQMIGATKQNIDATTQNIDSTVSAMIQLLTQYLQGVNQTASNAARLV